MKIKKTERASGDSVGCVILAAGKGVRMKSAFPKVLHKICGKPMALYSIERALDLGCDPTVVVLGNGAELASKILPENVKTAIQEKQLGTGHAVQCGIKPIKNAKINRVLILYGDTPLLTTETLRGLLNAHKKSGKALAVLTAKMPQPNRFGRVVRKPDGTVERVVEAGDATPEELKIEEINAGIYVVDFQFLKKALNALKPNNVQGEYYLTDIIEVAAKKGQVVAHPVKDFNESLGVNDRVEMANAEREMNRRTLRALMTAGVTVIDPQNTYVNPTVKIGADTIVYPGAVIEGDTKIGRECVIGQGVFIKDSEIADKVEIRAHCVLESAKVGEETTVGPSAHLRPESVIGRRCRIGNFVETKKTVLGENTKASHLTYLGDAKIGKNVNIGCGTITCNYDGANKHLTIIEDDVFVGSDSQLVAPIKVGRGAYIGSGSTITKDVPAGSLSVARGRQRDIVGGGDRLRKRSKKK